MTNLYQMEECLICSGQNRTMIPLQKSLTDHGDMTVGEVLQYLKFFPILSYASLRRSLCFTCATKCQSCYQLKINCERIEQEYRTVGDLRESLEFPLRIVKSEVDYDKVYKENFRKNHSPGKCKKTPEDVQHGANSWTSELDTKEFKAEEVDHYLPNIQEANSSTYLSLKRDIDIDEGIFTTTKESKTTVERKPFLKRRFTCTICAKSFGRKQDWRQHYRIHTGERPYVCDVCNKQFTQSGNLNVHKLIHTGEKCYVCDICNKSFIRPRDLIKHKVLHSGEKPYACDICNKSFSRSDNLVQHKLIHATEKPHVCDVCNKSFAHKTLLVAHKLNHTGEKPYVCDLCDKSFTRSSNLKKHQLTHSNEKLYACNVCEKSYNQASNLRRHQLVHVNEAKG